MQNKCERRRFGRPTQYNLKEFEVKFETVQIRCKTIRERKCGFKVGVIGKIPYAEVGCEWKRKIEC